MLSLSVCDGTVEMNSDNPAVFKVFAPSTIFFSSKAMSDQTASDLAFAAAEHAALLGNLHRMQAALDALRAHHTTDPTMLAHVQCLEEGLKQKNTINAVGPESGLTPLLAACLKGDAAEMQLLLAFGADPAIEGGVHDTTHGGNSKFKEFPFVCRCTRRARSDCQHAAGTQRCGREPSNNGHWFNSAEYVLYCWYHKYLQNAARARRD